MEVICVKVHFLATLEFVRQIHCQGVETYVVEWLGK